MKKFRLVLLVSGLFFLMSGCFDDGKKKSESKPEDQLNQLYKYSLTINNVLHEGTYTDNYGLYLYNDNGCSFGVNDDKIYFDCIIKSRSEGEHIINSVNHETGCNQALFNYKDSNNESYSSGVKGSSITATINKWGEIDSEGKVTIEGELRSSTGKVVTIKGFLEGIITD